jgi:hypothetical protein
MTLFMLLQNHYQFLYKLPQFHWLCKYYIITIHSYINFCDFIGYSDITENIHCLIIGLIYIFQDSELSVMRIYYSVIFHA